MSVDVCVCVQYIARTHMRVLARMRVWPYAHVHALKARIFSAHVYTQQQQQKPNHGLYQYKAYYTT